MKIDILRDTIVPGIGPVAAGTLDVEAPNRDGAYLIAIGKARAAVLRDARLDQIEADLKKPTPGNPPAKRGRKPA